ncbi:hypothetical protein NOVOSPHI9U_620023 [Novosphingobium sp. 9U]|nr:hypothetical protein NOVOSPHI9U_620023 [Novosphingobium sp. 9U]
MGSKKGPPNGCTWVSVKLGASLHAWKAGVWPGAERHKG